MSAFRLILASLRHYWRTHLAVGAGVAVAAAVLTGALLVGDSMRGSLRYLVLDRLGRVEHVLLSDRFFRWELANELAAAPEFPHTFDAAVPAILLEAGLQNADPDHPARINDVNLVGCDERFWRLGHGAGEASPSPLRDNMAGLDRQVTLATRTETVPSGWGPRRVVLNRAAADALGVDVGDTVLLRLPQPGDIPAESPLGRRHETVGTSRLEVAAIVSNEGLGRFGLQAIQHLPRNAYVPLDWLADRLDQAGRGNAILVAGGGRRGARSRASENAVPDHRRLQTWLKPKLTDFGLRLEKTPRGYFQITSDRMVLGPRTEAALSTAVEQLVAEGGRAESAITYLANTIAVGHGEQEAAIPYSTVTGIDFAEAPPLGPFRSARGQPLKPLADDEIALNTWAAEQLQAGPRMRVRITYFLPETTHGEPEEHTVEKRVAAIVELAGAAADRDLTPRVEGITDELTMGDWDPPFPFDPTRIRPDDEHYWEEHGPTPKAFVSLATGQRLWSSRFGQTTGVRIVPPEGMSAEALQTHLTPAPDAMGFVFQPVRKQGLIAAAGTTPFNVLFLAFSFFLIAAAVMLIVLLFRLGVERRAAELGILTATGFGRRKIVRLLTAEGALVAALGSLAGMAAGVGYAALMVLGLRTWWLAAVVTPFLRMYVTPQSLIIGFLSGLVLAAVAIWWSVRIAAKVSPRRLMAGTVQSEADAVAQPNRWAPLAGRGLLALALLLGLVAGRMGEEMQAGAFFGAGALVLLGLMLVLRSRLRAGATGTAVKAGGGNLRRLAVRSAARNPGRSTLCVGLVASATFLIVAVSAFHLDPTDREPHRHSGDGGFALVAESTQPIYHDLNTPDGRLALGFTPEQEHLLRQCTVISLRVQPGDNASCLNLYQARQPRILGIPPALVEHGGFAWAETAATTTGERENPWLLLQSPSDPPVPMALEKNVATYSLHLYGGVGETYSITDAQGRTVELEIAALLANSILQGDLLIDEQELLRLFPEVTGYRFFLIAAPSEHTAAVRRALESVLGDYGFAAEPTGERLAGFLAVQNTYLSTFQSLGGLGLLLGTFGLAVVQMRSVFERRAELALLRAAGFRRRRIAALVLLENTSLLLAGLGVGLGAALVAVFPHLAGRTAAVPFGTLAATLGVVLATGLAAGALAVRAALRTPLLPALRQERP